MGRRGFLALAVLATVAGAAPGAQGAVVLVREGTFASPTHVAAAPGEPGRLFVVERAGRVRTVVFGTTVREAFLDLQGDVDDGGERGLLSIAFPPDHARSHLLYTFVTDRTGRIRVDEWRRATPDRVDPASRRLVLEAPPAPAHNGGQLAFGPDGFLYVGIGDAAVLYTDREQTARDLSKVQGKILRIDPRAQPGGVPYAVPPDNPFAGTPGAEPAIWSWGLRNPFRFSFDRLTGDLAIGDVGEHTVEEVDFVTRAGGGGRGADFGWPCFEGRQPFRDDRAPPCDAPGHVPPVLERLTSTGACAIVGGVVVRDPALPALAGRYVYGDFCTGELRSASLRVPSAIDDRPLGSRRGSVVSFGEDACGRVYVVALGGGLSRLAQSGHPSGCPRDTRAPRLTLTRPRVRGRTVTVRVRCDEPCRARARAGRRRSRERALVAHRLTTLRIVLRRAPARVPRVTVTARDRAGNTTKARR